MAVAPRLCDSVIHPGELFFGEGPGCVQTLLGSCVAATFWHPHRRLGGICHYVLPDRAGALRPGPLDGRYGVEALELIRLAAVRHATYPADYVVKLFGGGNMFPRKGQRRLAPTDDELIGSKNVAIGRRVLAELGFVLSTQDVGGTGYRVIVLDLERGDVTVRYRDPIGATERPDYG